MLTQPGLFLLLLFAALAPGVGTAEGVAVAVEAIAPGKAGNTVVYVIPVKSEINTPTLYILRRGLKDAIEGKADAVVLDMDTPGGALDTTFEIMEALDKFPGQKITFVNNEAMSAGAFISAATDEIYFAPDAIIGAAAPVLATGGDVDKTMKQKIVSYLRARMRASSEGKGYRGQVISAMIDDDYELKIGDKVLKAKGELLSLTASEAMENYGDPPQALLGSGKVESITALLDVKFGEGRYTVRDFQVTWSEELAQHLNRFSPILLGLGLLALFVEFKTPGFGVFGITGIVLLGIVFLGNYVAGFSGHEPLLLFALGLLLIALELLFFPGVAVVAVFGLLCMLGSLVWAMADLWPGVPLTTAWSADAFVAPLQNMGLGLALAVVLAVVLARYLPHGWIFGRLVVDGAVLGTGVPAAALAAQDSLVGKAGIAATGLFPSGQVEIDGRRYEARVEVGMVEAGRAVRVLRRTDFSLIVEESTP